jgi:glutaredoxin
MKAAGFIVVLFCLIATAGIGQAAIYKWVDENGTISFRDTPPPRGVEAEIVNPVPLGAIKYDSGQPQNEVTRKGTSGVPPKPAAAISGKKQKRSFPKVELYVTSWCGYCAKAKSFLRRNGVPFKAYDVERDRRAAKRHLQLNPRGGVPVAVIGKRTIRGFSPDTYRQVLGL